jgi:hypothetical protein
MKPTKETKEQFIERYQKGYSKNIPFEDDYVALLCDCEDGGGPTHWAAVPKNLGLIKHHLEFYAPEGTLWPEGVPKPKDEPE